MIRFLRFSALALLLVPAFSLAQDLPVDRPNVVFLFADDWGRYASAYAEPDRPTLNDVIQTPNFDALADNGVLFWDAHVSCPSCSPSRTAVLTGRHFFRNGSGSQLHSPWSGDPAEDPVKTLESYHTLLEDAGYHTGVTYKTHVSMHLFVDNTHQYNPTGRRFNSFSQQVMKGETAEQREQIKQTLLNEVMGNFAAFLDARETEDQPFCWYFSPTNPHRSWAWGSAQTIWDLEPDELKGKMPAFLPDHEVVRQDMADYLGECMAFDLAIGVIVEHLRAIDELDNTILVVSGDHGAPGFPRGKTNLYDFGTQVPLLIHWPAGVANPGRRIDNPTSLIDLAPTYLDATGLPPHEGIDGRSLLPILKDPDAQGLTGLGNQYVITGRERHFTSARQGNLPYPSRAIRTHEFLYIENQKPGRWPMFEPPLSAGLPTHGDLDGGPTKQLYAQMQQDPDWANWCDLAWGKRPAAEFYDLRADPDQVNNLLHSSELRDIRWTERSTAEQAEAAKTLRGLLFLEMRGGQDPRIVGEGDAFDRPPYWKQSR